MRTSSPRITVPVVNQPNFIGTLNPDALNEPLFKKSVGSKSLDEVAELTTRLDAIKREYEELQGILDSMLNTEKPTPFCQFKKAELDFEKRAQLRDSELAAFSKYMNTFRSDPNPTFVEVNAAREKTPMFDLIAFSLLVSNRERASFNREDIAHQNEELQTLVDQQGEALRIVTARMKLFAEHQRANAVEVVHMTLGKGRVPGPLSGATPTRALELRTKRKLLSAELAVLVDARRKVILERLAVKMARRAERDRNAKAVRIQSVFRGFMSRMELKREHAAATTIQRRWRGYYVRWQQSRPLMDMDDSSSSEARPMKRVVKKRINPDGEEQEYYDYEYEEEVSEAEEEEDQAEEEQAEGEAGEKANKGGDTEEAEAEAEADESKDGETQAEAEDDGGAGAEN